MPSANLGLPFIEGAQAQKHVTHNEALRVLDTLVQLAVLDRDLSAPPALPGEGERWIVAASPTGAWAGHATHVAAWQDGGWQFSAPQLGWVAYVIGEGTLVAWNGSAWGDFFATVTALQNLSRLGIGTTADAANPFSARLNNALWIAKPVAEGGDGGLRYKMSKESAADTLSLLMQTNFSGRAEIGLAGDDHLHVKVSPDGTTFREGIVVDKDTGAVRFPQGIEHAGSGLSTALYIPSPVREIWRLDAARPGTPRTYTIGSVSGAIITLTTGSVDQLFSDSMRDHVAVRIWNTSKTPAQSAWVDWNISAAELQVTDANHIATWANGETIRLGDPNPTGDNVLQMVALDISAYLFNQLGAVFPQKGVFLGVFVASSDGPSALDFSATGASGTAMGGNALSNGIRNQMALPIPTSTPSPISNSNLLFVREQLFGGSTDVTIAFARVLGVYV